MDYYIELSHEPKYIRMVTQAVLNFEAEHGTGIPAKDADKVGLAPGGIFAFSENDELLGGITYHILNDWVFIGEGFVWEPHRRKGIYSALMAELETVARASGKAGLDVWTYEWEAPAVYEALGFTKNGVHRNFPKGNTSIQYIKEFEVA